MRDLSLLAGIVGSDGHLEKSQPVIRIINKNKKFIRFIATLVRNLIGKIPTITTAISGFRKQKVILVFSSKEIWETLQKKFNIPSGKKSDRIKPLNSLSNEEKIGYMLGWIAGDGSVTTDRGRVKIEIWSKSSEILRWFKEILEENGIESRIWKSKEDDFILRIGKKSAVQKFHEKWEIPHPEKEKKLTKLLNDSQLSTIRTS